MLICTVLSQPHARSLMLSHLSQWKVLLTSTTRLLPFTMFSIHKAISLCSRAARVAALFFTIRHGSTVFNQWHLSQRHWVSRLPEAPKRRDFLLNYSRNISTLYHLAFPSVLWGFLTLQHSYCVKWEIIIITKKQKNKKPLRNILLFGKKKRAWHGLC